MLIPLFEIFKQAVLMVGKNDSPMSCVFPLVCALKNETSRIIGCDNFDGALGEGAGLATKALLAVRFNLTGKPPRGRKVGILDEYQLWAFLLDPYARQLRFEIPNEVVLVKNMIEYFAPGDSNIMKRQNLLCEYQFYKTATGPFQSFFDNNVEEEEKDNPMDTVPILKVNDWVTTTGNHVSRLSWWESWARSSLLYKTCARPLMSLRSCGSMTVERAAKPLKNCVYSKSRERLGYGKASALLRAGLNLRFLQQTKMAMKDLTS